MNSEKRTRIFCDNIRELSLRIERTQTQRSICVSQLADGFLNDSPADRADALYGQFIQAFPAATAADKALFCRRLAASPRHGSLLFGRGSFDAEDSTAPGSHGKVSLVRNRYNEDAFDCFSQAISHAKAIYLSSFTDACEDVFNNRSEFCVLPIENAEDGRLFGFYAMLDRYELKICACCELETEATSNHVRYALVGRALPDHLPKSPAWNLEYSVVSEAGTFPVDIPTVAPQFEASLQKIDSLPVLYDDGLRRFYFTFRLPQACAMAFDLYLTMEHPHYTPIGFYPTLTKK